MIQDSDGEFHPEGGSVPNWTETQFLIFSVPEAAITGCVYVLARPNLGICHSSVNIAQGICLQPWEIAYGDPQMHMPCPQRFSNFRLWNGLDVEVLAPLREYQYRYEGVEGSCRFELNFSALMHPFDTHDPEENRLLPQGGDVAEATGFGDGWANGHFDTLGHITGSLVLHGREYAVDCVDGMDRSWGPRSEANVPGVTWLHVTFGRELGFHLAMGLSFVSGQVVYGPLRFGYVVDGADRRSVVAATVTAQRSYMLPTRMALEITDEHGHSWSITGTAIATAPWNHFTPSNVAYVSLFRFEHAGKVGYSHVADVFGLNFMAKGMAAQGT